jgi:hypothetical protein
MLYAVTRKTLLLAALVAFATSTAFARDDIRTERVHFKPGASSATVKGKIKGYTRPSTTCSRPARVSS